MLVKVVIFQLLLCHLTSNISGAHTHTHTTMYFDDKKNENEEKKSNHPLNKLI
jgi:hypothetical protein